MINFILNFLSLKFRLLLTILTFIVGGQSKKHIDLIQDALIHHDPSLWFHDDFACYLGEKKLHFSELKQELNLFSHSNTECIIDENATIELGDKVALKVQVKNEYGTFNRVLIAQIKAQKIWRLWV